MPDTPTVYAYCKVLTNPHAVQRYLDAGRTTLRDTRGRITRIRTDRLRAAYQLIHDAVEPIDE